MGGLRQGRFCFQWVAETGVGEVGSMHLNDDLDLMETGRMFGRVDGGGLGRKWGCERRLGIAIGGGKFSRIFDQECDAYKKVKFLLFVDSKVGMSTEKIKWDGRCIFAATDSDA